MNTTRHSQTDIDAAAAAATAPTMRAVVQERYGSSDTWRLLDIPRPAIGDHEVLIQVRAAGLDRGTWHEMTGRPYLMRVMGFGLRGPKSRVPGRAVAGTVAVVGSKVTRFKVGDDVFGVSTGAYAEFAAAHDDKLAPKPSTLTFEQAAAVPISATTAIQGLRLGRIAAGQQVLIIGASGGVGTYAVQLARAFGAEVTGVCSASKAELVRALGADRVIDYATEDAWTAPTATTSSSTSPETPRSDGYDGRSDRRAAWSSSAARAKAVSRAASDGAFAHRFVSLFVRPRLTMLVSSEQHADLLALTALIDAGQLTPSIDTTYTLEHSCDAMRQLEAGTVRGKISITVPRRP